MAHLVNYENANTERDRALAAIQCSQAKHSKNRAWNWALTAAEHAVNCGIQDARDMLGYGRWPALDDLRTALKAKTATAPTIQGVLSLAQQLPSGLNDPRAADKLLTERDELIAALEEEDAVGALLEGADAVYYACKYLQWVSEALGVTIDALFLLTVAKYTLRARPGNPKDDAVEREVIKAIQENLR